MWEQTQPIKKLIVKHLPFELFLMSVNVMMSALLSVQLARMQSIIKFTRACKVARVQSSFA